MLVLNTPKAATVPGERVPESCSRSGQKVVGVSSGGLYAGRGIVRGDRDFG